MTTVHVVVPVLRGRTIFIVDKGRQWSVIEHLLLEALAKQAWQASRLAKHAGIPRRVVVEAVIRLMRAGWVEVHFDKGLTVFKATARGLAVASSVELPKIPELRKRPTNYIIDLVSGEVFRNKDFAQQSEDDLRKRAETENFIWIEPASWHTTVDINEALEVLLDPDETFVSAQAAGMFRRSVLVTVRDGIIVSGLPEKRSLPLLRSTVLAAAQHRLDELGEHPSKVFEVQEPASTFGVKAPVLRSIRFEEKDLVMDGAAHREVLLRTLKEARSRVFIHSTFISQKHVEALLPELEKAVERGVKINVFWGQSEETEVDNTTQIAIAALRRLPTIRRMNEGLSFHPYSTGSHAKLLIADTQKAGEYVAVVGSCNWLTTGFVSYETSIVLRDPTIVGDVMKYFAMLTCVHDGVWSELASEVVQICRELAKQPGTKHPNATAAIVVGGHHNDFIALARDQAAQRVFVASHRLGVAAKPGVVAPLISAAKAKEIRSEVYYGRLTSPVKASSGARLVASAAAEGVDIALVAAPRLHAKILAWDADNLLATSLNWLSADQVNLNSLKEIGVFLRAAGAASNLTSNFRDAVQREILARTAAVANEK